MVNVCGFAVVQQPSVFIPILLNFRSREQNSSPSPYLLLVIGLNIWIVLFRCVHPLQLNTARTDPPIASLQGSLVPTNTSFTPPAPRSPPLGSSNSIKLAGPQIIRGKWGNGGEKSCVQLAWPCAGAVDPGSGAWSRVSRPGGSH